MFCPNCGKQILEGHKFCGNCGWGVGTDVVAKSNEAVKQVATAVASGATKAKESASKALKSEQAKKIKNWFGTKENKLIFIAIILMLISIFVACKGYNYDKDGFVIPFINFNTGIGEVHDILTLMPNLLSTLVAIAIYSGVVIRNKVEIFAEPIKLTLCVVNILFLASLTSVFVSSKPWSIPFFNINNYAILIVAIALSWLGMKAISGYAWIILLITSMGQMTKVNAAMGFNGTVYILCAFVSLGMQLTSGFLVVDPNTFKSEFYNTKEIVVGDMNKSIEATKQGVNNVVNAGKIAATAATGVPFTAIGSNDSSATKIEDQ